MTQRCRSCGCSNFSACAGGCWWVEDDLCSSCATAVDVATGSSLVLEELPSPIVYLTIGDLARRLRELRQ